MTRPPQTRPTPPYGREAAYAVHPGAADAGAPPDAPAPNRSPAPTPGTVPPFRPPTGPVGDAAPPGWSVPPSAPRVAPPRNDLAVWSLVLGLLGVMGCVFLTGVPAVVVGHQARRAVAAGQADNDGTALAGIVLGWVATALGVLLTLLLVLGLLLPLLVVGLAVPFVQTSP